MEFFMTLVNGWKSLNNVHKELILRYYRGPSYASVLKEAGHQVRSVFCKDAANLEESTHVEVQF